jgi:biotin carboxyl carrier protein
MKNKTIYLSHPEFGAREIRLKDRFPKKEKEKIKGGYECPMPSQIVKVLVEKGQLVNSGDALIILSSMKMENTIEAYEKGVVEQVLVNEGENVEAGFLLLKINSSSEN